MIKKFKKPQFLFIIIFTSISLIGIIITQWFWVRNAQLSKEEHFKNRVRVALKSVVNQIRDLKSDSSSTFFCAPICERRRDVIIERIPIDSLDKLIRDEFNNLIINLNYEFIVYNPHNKNILYGKYKAATSKILNSVHKVSLTCLMRNNAYNLAVYFPEEKAYIFNQILGSILLSAFFTIILIVSFVITINSLNKQKKLAVLKSDFVNNMTHEFKTPIASISLASEMLLNPDIQCDKTRISNYANIIYKENNRLKGQVEHVLNTAMIESSQLKINKELVNIHFLLCEVISEFEMQIRNRNGVIIQKLESSNPSIFVDRELIKNVISNLIDNAIKYSPTTLEINIKTKDVENFLSLTIEDKGIGIKPEYRNDVFKQFFRVPTGNVHDTKGFGLGLFYVKSILNLHNANISITSKVDAGTSFEIKFIAK